MTEYRLRQITSTYFDILEREGIPEKYVYGFKCEGDEVIVTILTGKTFRKKLKGSNVKIKGDVRGGLVSGIGVPLAEYLFQRDRLQATQAGENQSRDNT